MASNKNYVLGYGERLTEPIPGPRMNPSKKHPYTLDEAFERLGPRIESVANELNELPDEVCPNDESVAIMTLHPAYTAKSYFPGYLLKNFGLRSIGSRPIIITPEKSQKKGTIQPESTVDLFVAGKRSDFQRFSKNLSTITSHLKIISTE